MKKVFKWILGILLVLAVAGYGAYEATRPLDTALLTLATGDVAVTFRETGSVTAAGTRDLYPETALTIRTVHVQEGDAVKAGDILVTLDATPLERQLVSLEAQIAGVSSTRDSALRTLKDRIAQQEISLTESKRQLDVAKAEQARVTTLRKTEGATKAEQDAADNAVAGLENVIRQLEKDLAQTRTQAGRSDSETDRVYASQADVLRTQADTIRADLPKAMIKAPIDGIVSAVAAKEGQPALPQVALLSLLEAGERHVEVFVRAEDAGDLSLGMKATVLREGRAGDVELAAQILSIAPSAVERMSTLGLVEKRVKVKLKVEALDDATTAVNDAGSGSSVEPGTAPPNVALFITGGDVDVLFTTHREDGVIAVPKTAIFKHEGGDAVWVVRAGKAAIQPIRGGLENDLDQVVTEGLKAGDVVVRDPNVEGLKEGKAVVDSRG